VTRRRNHALWIGPLIVFVGGVSYFMVFATIPALRDVPWVNLPAVLIGLAISGLAMWRAFARREAYRGRVLGPLGLVFSLALSGLFCFYVFSFSYRLPPSSAGVAEGSVAPGFTLAAHDGREVSLGELRGEKVVLVFYRGFW
jgi:hypothetical protein